MKNIYLDGDYLNDNKTWHEEDSPWKAKQINRILEKNEIIPKTISEVGCGAGEILRQLSIKRDNCEFSGYEISPQAYEIARKKESVNIKYYNDDILKYDLFSDVLLCIDVFEHVEDYYDFLRKIKLKASYKVFHIPLDIDVYRVMRGLVLAGRYNIGHIHYFTRESALATLRDCGYEIIDENYTLIFDYLIEKKITTRLFQLAQKLLYKINPHFAVRTLGGCSLIVLAK